MRFAGAVTTATLAGAVVLAAAPAAARAGETVAVFPFEGYKLPVAIEMAPFGLTSHVSRTLEAAGDKILEPPLGLRDMLVAMACDTMDGACATRVGAHLHADRIVIGTLYGDAPPTSARPVAKGRAKPMVWVRIRVFTADGAAPREINETVAGTVSDLTAEFNRIAHLVVGLVHAPVAAEAARPRDAAGAGAAGVVPPGTVAAVAPARASSWSAVRVAGVGVAAAGVAAGAVAAAMAARWYGARASFASGVEPYRGADGVLALPSASAEYAGERDLCADGALALEPSAAADLEARGVFGACRRLRASALIGWLAGAAAGALVGTGVVLIVTGKRSPADADTPAPAAALRLVPYAGPGGAGATAVVTF